LIINQRWAFYAYNATPTDTNLTDMQIFNNNDYDTSNLIGYDPTSKNLIVSYRGTVVTDFANWEENIDAIKSPYYTGSCSDCYIHRGFYEDYNSTIE